MGITMRLRCHRFPFLRVPRGPGSSSITEVVLRSWGHKCPSPRDRCSCSIRAWDTGPPLTGQSFPFVNTSPLPVLQAHKASDLKADTGLEGCVSFVEGVLQRRWGPQVPLTDHLCQPPRCRHSLFVTQSPALAFRVAQEKSLFHHYL